jgi:hypothetical protein
MAHYITAWGGWGDCIPCSKWNKSASLLIEKIKRGEREEFKERGFYKIRGN